MNFSSRLKFHFEPLKGWMNDPNGLIQFKGEYHAFFQHYPFDTKWGPMHWGHATSKDLIHWEHKPIALYPDQEYENNGGCFSGSAIEFNDKLHIFYTGVGKSNGQSQCHAVMQDENRFIKDPKNPIIKSPPIEYGINDFRDPKVVKIENTFYMVVGTGKDGIGRVLLYKSSNLENWTFLNLLVEGKEYGQCCECPDLIQIDNQFFLMFSQMTGQGIGTLFFHLKYENGTFTVDKKLNQPIIGPDFYAPQTFHDDKGRRIIIGWLYNWKRVPPKEVDYAGAFTIPCELKYKEGKIVVNPIDEISHELKSESKFVEIQENKLIINGKPSVIHEGKIENIKILEDVKTIEVWINNGEFYYSTWLF
ncbi:Glycosyl hydrolases family 32 protein [Trichomonas vaginalis G3]|uniref:beta-fructofuranosidase n=1 Tax=Trichomonas vaginalis (strain ATCC PRA-98 / G3) TaxID=412133 RepID=A2DMT0_TRIV3|nr:glycosyl hydrolase [Trichomonas vaginalis G3]EAY18301.1 Glycosyl hydrolases family 32 protein [Trichomonas vaginalis G3]KAI5541876.1 beta-fructofuranosidase protein [Trichomonas vaginalis G3]|eukprot:XP_001579287.1 glycosyl hydrolase [Trichomonas vaginalis G3]